MPFYYELPTPDLGGSADEPIKLVRWLAEPRDWLEAGTPVAIVELAGLDYEVLANGTAIMGEWLLAPGEAVHSGEPMAVLYADGECIPYGRPYSLARRA